MAIPPLDRSGLLPRGVHDCTLAEMKARFGSFQASDRRPQLFGKFELFVREAKEAGLVRRIVVNGSFATGKADPNDIDIIVVVASTHDFSAELKPAQYNVLSKTRVRRRYGFDLLVAREDSIECHRWTEFFQQVRLEPGRQKGILSINI